MNKSYNTRKNRNLTTFAPIVVIAVTLMTSAATLMTSAATSVYSTTEDDGWTEDEVQSQEELEETYEDTQWEDDIGPNDFEDGTENQDEDDTENQDEETQICPDGSEIQADEECPSVESPPICDGSFQDCITSNGNFCEAGSDAHECEIEPQSFAPPAEELFDCPDGTVAATADACELPLLSEVDCGDGTFAATAEDCELPVDCGDGTFAATAEDCELPVDCGDGTFAATAEECEFPLPPKNVINCPEVPFYMTCKDINDNGKTKVIEKTTVIQSASASATANANANAADVSNCKLDGSANGIQQKFDATKYLACGLYAGGQMAYSDGFVAGCTQIGNSQLVCQALADSSILNTKTQPIQTQTQTQTPTQSQAIQPAAVGR
jgi:hypothetical protein